MAPEIGSDVRGGGLAGVPLSAAGSPERHSPHQQVSGTRCKDGVGGTRTAAWSMGLLIVCFNEICPAHLRKPVNLAAALI